MGFFKTLGNGIKSAFKGNNVAGTTARISTGATIAGVVTIIVGIPLAPVITGAGLLVAGAAGATAAVSGIISVVQDSKNEDKNKTATQKLQNNLRDAEVEVIKQKDAIIKLKAQVDTKDYDKGTLEAQLLAKQREIEAISNRHETLKKSYELLLQQGFFRLNHQSNQPTSQPSPQLGR